MMIGEGPSLIEILPPRLNEALDEELHPGEELVLAVRGNPREALAATAARLLTLREAVSGSGTPSVETYPLAEVTGVELREEGPAPGLLWRLRGRDEPGVFAVPAYDLGKFRRAGEILRRLVPGGVAGRGPAAAEAAARRCPKCGSAQPAEAAFCPACGLQSRDVCWDCGRALETEWRFCPACGSDAAELGVVPCPSCREPVARGYAYCPRCGAAARPICDECDRVLRRSWQFCPDCGAATAEDEVDGGGRLEREPGVRLEPATPFPEPSDVRAAGSTADAEALNQQGMEAYERERFREAIQCFQRAVEMDPNNATFHCNLAVAYGEERLDEEALASYQRCLALDSGNQTALVSLGYLYSERERYEEARDCWERAIRAAPNSPEADEARKNLESLEQL
jgi:tetratricopeptide (TPR) repeat protein